MRITGKTRIMFILADAVDHILGSDVLNSAFEKMGLDVAVSPLSIASEDLPNILDILRRTKNVIGFGVTIPHKIAAASLVDELTDAARAIGAVNFVRRDADGRLVGHNIDGEGFLAGLAEHGVDVRGASVLQVGAGGAGRAIAFALAEAGVASLHLLNRDQARGEELAAAVRRRSPATQIRLAPLEEVGAVDLIVNATSLGMHEDDPLPVPPSRLAPSATVAEVIMRPAMTPLLTEAQRAGCRIVPGLAMMEPQPRLVAQFLGLTD